MKKNHLFSIITAGMLTITLLAGCEIQAATQMQTQEVTQIRYRRAQRIRHLQYRRAKRRQPGKDKTVRQLP